MGQVSWLKAAIAGFLLVVAYVLVGHLESKSEALIYPAALAESLLVKEPWRPGREIPIEENIVKALLLDDYLYREYQSSDQAINLYVGFYHSADKIGAAHDPLVCFQGQGWVVSDKNTGVVEVSGNSGHQVNYASMVARNTDRQEYVFYWFQSFDSAANSTYEQKLKMVTNKLTGQGTANAFVRVTTAIKDEPIEDAYERSVAFVKSFYPAFYNYVTQVEQQ